MLTFRGDSASPDKVDTPPGVIFTAIAAGPYHNCAIDTRGDIWCWGYNPDGRLGVGTDGDERDTPTLVNAPGVTFTHVSLGWSHTCALDTTDRTWCWGSASRGRLGNGANAGTSLSPANVELPDGVTFVALGLGHDHSCAIDTEGLPWCWGSNDRAALGNGTNDDGLEPVKVDAPSDTTFDSIIGGAGHTCAVSTADTVWCWGANDFGQLGDGTTDDHIEPAPVVGFP